SKTGIIKTLRITDPDKPDNLLLFVGGIGFDAAGNLLFSSAYSLRRTDPRTGGSATYIAGNNLRNFRGEGRPATKTYIFSPDKLVSDSDGNIFINDFSNGLIRKLDARTGNVQIVAGNGIPAALPPDGKATEPTTATDVTISRLFALDKDNNLFVSTVTRILRIDAKTGSITTVAGNGELGSVNGDGGPALEARLGPVSALATDTKGNLFMTVAPDLDTRRYNVRRVDAQTGIITTVAGNGKAGTRGDGGPAIDAGFDMLNGMVIDKNDNLFLVDLDRIRRVDSTTSIITTVAGNGKNRYRFKGEGKKAKKASIGFVSALAIDSLGNIFIGARETIIADQPFRICIWRVDAKTGIITKFVETKQNPSNGNSLDNPRGDGGPLAKASLFDITALGFDKNGNLLIADSESIRLVKLPSTSGLNQ
ncbi:MAG: hypothetical protein AB1489_30640, partial [Acidobacteriota bacterium]